MREDETHETAGSPCRLFVYLAQDAPLGVVLRRGPSDWVQLSVWHTDTDTFEHGQWFRGRVYERRCDLSADGSLYAYFAGRESRAAIEERPNSWIALSRPPYFTALALWFVGGTYCLGGFFPGRQSLFIGGATAPPDRGQVPSWLSLTPLPPYVDRTPDATERTVYFNRLLRAGWTPTPSIDAPDAHWEHRDPNSQLILMMLPLSDSDFDAYGGPHVVEYAVRSTAGDNMTPLGRATWADWDHRGRLVIAQDGRLLHWQAPGVVEPISDFNGMDPDPQPPPEWAYPWPDPP